MVTTQMQYLGKLEKQIKHMRSPGATDAQIDQLKLRKPGMVDVPLSYSPNAGDKQAS